MKKFIISIDSSCDCDIKELIEKDISVIFFKYSPLGDVINFTLIIKF